MALAPLPPPENPIPRGGRDPDLAPVPAAPGVPVALPSGVDRYRVGDEWSYERVDLLDGGRRQQLLQRVTAIQDGRVSVNDGMHVLDQMGGILRNRFGSKQPALLVIPSDLQVGRRWRTAFINKHDRQPPARSYYDGRVDALETVEVPAGRFRCYRLELQGESESERGFGRLLRVRVWVDPTTMLKVRDEIVRVRAEAAARKGWMFDTYLLRRR